MFRDVGKYLPFDAAWRHRRFESSSKPLSEPQTLILLTGQKSSISWISELLSFLKRGFRCRKLVYHCQWERLCLLTVVDLGSDVDSCVLRRHKWLARDIGTASHSCISVGRTTNFPQSRVTTQKESFGFIHINPVWTTADNEPPVRTNRRYPQYDGQANHNCASKEHSYFNQQFPI
jgi:hypothetical protein